MRLKLRRWDPSTMKPHRIILLVGRRGTGKSSLMEDLLYRLSPNIDIALAMSPTEDSLGMFRNHMPESWLFEGYSQSKVEELIEMQRSLATRNKQKNVLLALDDCMYEKSIMRTTAMRNIHMNGRHLKTTLINACQYMVDVDPALRTQIDYVVCLKENIYTNKVKLHRFFFGCFRAFDDFSAVLDKVTENYGALVLDQTSPSNNLEDCLFWYRASLDLPAYRLGSPIFWTLAQRYAKKNARNSDDASQVKSKKSQGRLTCIQRADEHGRVLKEDKGLTLLC